MTSADRRLEVSIVVSSAIAPAWIEALVRRLAASPRFEVLLFLEPPAPRHAWPRAYRAYERVDARLFRRRRDALARVPLPGPPPRELTALDECDVLLHFGSGDPAAVIGATRYGVWILSHVDEQERRRVPPLFWEMYRRSLYRTTLEVHLPDGDRRVVYSSHGRPNRTSLHRSRNEAYWKSQGRSRGRSARSATAVSRTSSPDRIPRDSESTTTKTGLRRPLQSSGTSVRLGSASSPAG